MGDIPMRLGNICSLSMLLWTHAMRCSMYWGAGILVGRLKFSLSCHRYSNLEKLSERNLSLLEKNCDGNRTITYSSVAFISGQLCGEQNSVIEP